MSYIEELIADDEIEERIEELGELITEDYGDENVTVVCVLNGAFIFTADLVRAMDVAAECSFIKVSSYDGKTSTGNIQLSLDLSKEDIEGKNILIVEDIVDTGNTIVFLKKHLEKFSPKSIKICTFLIKEKELKHKIHLDYVGFSIPSLFVVGYGLDYNGLYRDLPYLGVLLENEDENINLKDVEIKKGR